MPRYLNDCVLSRRTHRVANLTQRGCAKTLRREQQTPKHQNDNNTPYNHAQTKTQNTAIKNQAADILSAAYGLS